MQGKNLQVALHAFIIPFISVYFIVTCLLLFVLTICLQSDICMSHAVLIINAQEGRNPSGRQTHLKARYLRFTADYLIPQ